MSKQWFWLLLLLVIVVGTGYAGAVRAAEGEAHDWGALYRRFALAEQAAWHAGEDVTKARLTPEVLAKGKTSTQAYRDLVRQSARDRATGDAALDRVLWNYTVHRGAAPTEGQQSLAAEEAQLRLLFQIAAKLDRQNELLEQISRKLPAAPAARK